MFFFIIILNLLKNVGDIEWNWKLKKNEEEKVEKKIYNIQLKCRIDMCGNKIKR